MIFSTGAQENIKVVCLAWEKILYTKQVPASVPKFVIAVIEHPMTIDIQPLLHERACSCSSISSKSIVSFKGL